MNHRRSPNRATKTTELAHHRSPRKQSRHGKGFWLCQHSFSPAKERQERAHRAAGIAPPQQSCNTHREHLACACSTGKPPAPRRAVRRKTPHALPGEPRRFRCEHHYSKTPSPAGRALPPPQHRPCRRQLGPSSSTLQEVALPKQKTTTALAGNFFGLHCGLWAFGGRLSRTRPSTLGVRTTG